MSSSTTAAKIHPGDKRGLFVLRPPADTRGYGEAQQREIDNVLDNIAWRVGKTAKLSIDVRDESEALSECILDWADLEVA